MKEIVIQVDIGRRLEPILEESGRRFQKRLEEREQRDQELEEREAGAVQRGQQTGLDIQEVVDKSTNEIVAKLREINSILIHTEASLERLTQAAEPVLEMATNSRSKQ